MQAEFPHRAFFAQELAAVTQSSAELHIRPLKSRL